jgi:hypothetical protein
MSILYFVKWKKFLTAGGNSVITAYYGCTAVNNRASSTFCIVYIRDVFMEVKAFYVTRIAVKGYNSYSNLMQ